MHIIMKIIKRWPKQKFWIVLLVVILLIMAISATGAAYWVHSLDISILESPLAQPTFIYDQKGNKVSQLSSSKIVPVNLEQVPEHVCQAIIAVEDRRFYAHQGIDLRAILRALTRDFRSGDFSEGGSTITQQLAKNLFLPSDKTIRRKIKEAGYALKIEATLSKEQILEAYLNNIYFGEGRWGIENAACFYFGKKTAELTLVEGATLAGLLKAPSVYSPLNNIDKALERRNTVLSLMKEQNYISEAEFHKTKVLPITLKKRSDGELSGRYAPYVDYVLEEAISRYGFTQDQLLGSGLQIYTEMDQTVQDAAEAVFNDERFFPAGKPDQIVQSGIVVIDQATGGIKGLVGYRGKSMFRQFNHASQLKRQPGSTFKPLAVYGPALEKGYTPYSMLYDGALNIDGYQPVNWDYQTRGKVTMVDAIANSWNIPAVWLLNKIGIESGADFVRRAGITLEKEDFNPSLALGALTLGVSPLQMAEAYSSFANLGVRNKAYAIRKITTSDGETIIEAKPEAVKVTDPSTAYTMTLLLKNVVDKGTGKNAALGRPVAGKTGSVELPPSQEFAGISKGVKDVWFVGYTPELTAAVWMGYDQTDREHYLTTSGGSEPAVVFREVLSRALSARPVVQFRMPTGYNINKMFPPKPDKKEKQKSEKRSEFLKEFIIDWDIFTKKDFKKKGKGRKNK